MVKWVYALVRVQLEALA